MKEKILGDIKNVISELGYICVECKFKDKGINVIIYCKNKNISVDDCANISQILISKLELKYDNLFATYDLIVESPGVDRIIRSIEEFEIFSDKKFSIVLKDKKKYNLKNNEIVGNLVERRDNLIELSTDNGNITIDYNDIARARLYFNFKEVLKGKGKDL